jgi:hypothetical protein
VFPGLTYDVLDGPLGTSLRRRIKSPVISLVFIAIRFMKAKDGSGKIDNRQYWRTSQVVENDTPSKSANLLRCYSCLQVAGHCLNSNSSS